MSPLSAEARAWLAEAQDYSALARVSTRADFIAACPFAFLFAPRETLLPSEPGTVAIAPDYAEAIAAEARPLVFAVRKHQENFPSMITIGRTANHDIAIADWSISRFHAFVGITAGGTLTISDAGSKNGTFVDDRRLESGEPPTPLSLGQRVGIGRFTFLFIDSATCHDALCRR